MMAKIDLNQAHPGDTFVIERFPNQIRYIRSIKETANGTFKLAVEYTTNGEKKLSFQEFSRSGNGLGKFVNIKKIFTEGE